MAGNTDQTGATAAGDALASRIAGIADLVRRFCIADGNVTIYGLAHPLATNSIRHAYDGLTGMIAQNNTPVILHVADDQLLFEGFPVETRNAQVSRLVSRLIKLHVNSLHFLPGLTIEEFTGFHELLAMRETDIEANGGVRKLLDLAGIAHITVSGASYVLIEDDQRVVDRSASVAGPSAADDNAELVRYMLDEVLKQSREKGWLIAQIKNDPRKMASVIAEGIGQALAQSEKGQDEQETIQALIANIKSVGESLMDQQTGEVVDGHEDLKDAVLELEQEIQTRARQLMTNEDSKRFVSEILGVVATYSDHVKANRITREFLKGETNLKTTEKMLQKLAGKQETGEQLLVRLRDLMMRNGVAEEDLHKILQRVKQPAQPKRRKAFDQAVRDGIAQRIRKLGLDDAQHPEAIDQLTTFFENRLQERQKAFAQEAAQIGQAVSRRDGVLDRFPGGVVIWTTDGNVEYLNAAARQALRVETGVALAPAVLTELGRRTFPAGVIPLEEAEQKGWSPADYRLLCSVDMVVTDSDGKPIGAILGALNAPDTPATA